MITDGYENIFSWIARSDREPGPQDYPIWAAHNTGKCEPWVCYEAKFFQPTWTHWRMASPPAPPDRLTEDRMAGIKWLGAHSYVAIEVWMAALAYRDAQKTHETRSG